MFRIVPLSEQEDRDLHRELHETYCRYGQSCCCTRENATA